MEPTDEQLKDAVLRACIKSKEMAVSGTQLRGMAAIIEPPISSAKIKVLAERIQAERPELINLKDKRPNDYQFLPTGETQKFLNSGGFSKLESERLLKDAAEYEKHKKKEDIEMRLAISNIEANGLNKKNHTRNMWSSIINIVLGIINIYLLYKQVTEC